MTYIIYGKDNSDSENEIYLSIVAPVSYVNNIIDMLIENGYAISIDYK